MKQYLILLILVYLPINKVTAQISTPDFRYYKACPGELGQVNRCTGWVQATHGTSDYYNACAAAEVGVPDNLFGRQAATSNTYMGVISYVGRNISLRANYREYIGTDFAPLTIGQTYKMTVMVSLADKSQYAVDGLGVYFTTYAVSYSTFIYTLPVSPQVDYSDFGIIKDTTNWIRMTKYFKADSAYTHLTFGCFKPDSMLLIDSFSIHPNYPYAYYYVAQIGEPDSSRHSNTDFVTPPSTNGAPVITLADTLRIVFPNAFTPNNDASNDVFRIIYNHSIQLKDYVLMVFNRWGQRVFLTQDPVSGWDGTFNGTPQDMGTYFYLAEFTINGVRQRIKADVTLLR